MFRPKTVKAGEGREEAMTEIALIYDVGAHKGEDAKFYRRKSFSVIALEAVPPIIRDSSPEELICFICSDAPEQ
jgi:hypothetical protein